MRFLKYLSLERSGLKYKMFVSFSLMSIIPLLVMVYFVTNYLFVDRTGEIVQISAVVLFSLWVAWAGFLLARRLILPVINLAIETKIIAAGQYNSKLLLKRGDEIGDIANAVNTMTGKIRGYIGELQEYSQKTSSLNAKIHRKVLTLTNLMKLGDLISSGASFKEIINFAAERISSELFGGFCAIFVKEQAEKYTMEAFFNTSGKDVITSRIAEDLLSVEKLFLKDDCLVVDSSSLKKPWQRELKDKFRGMNVILYPIRVNVEIAGVILFGNFIKGLEFGEEEIEVLKAFENEIVLAYQSSQIFSKIKGMEIVDSLTGLYTFAYLEARLDDEISRSIYYQRPCSILMVDLDDFEKYTNYYGDVKAKQVLKQVGKLLNGIMPPVGKVSKSGSDEFGILLPELNKREAIEIAKDVQKKIEEMKISSQAEDKITASIGVGENPIDGASAKEVIEKAREYLKIAKDKGKNRVEGNA